jgi:ubiquinol-cytochrome c reductase cytochrome c subunit
LLAAPLVVGAVAVAVTLPRASAVEVPPSEYSGGGDIAPVPSKDLPRITDPAQIYRRDCATCHGGDAHGTARAPTLEGAGRAGVYYWVSTGRMPLPDLDTEIARRPPRYSPAVIAKLVDYVTGLAGGGGPDIPRVEPGDVSEGLHVFGLECAACHAWSGRGSIIFNGDAPSVLPATPTQIASAVRIGPGTMPAFGPAALTDTQLDNVVAYVRELRHPKDEGGFGLWHRGPTTEGAAALVLGLGALLLAIGWIGAKARLREHG